MAMTIEAGQPNRMSESNAQAWPHPCVSLVSVGENNRTPRPRMLERHTDVFLGRSCRDFRQIARFCYFILSITVQH